MCVYYFVGNLQTMEREVNLAKTHSMHNHRRASVEVLLKVRMIVNECFCFL